MIYTEGMSRNRNPWLDILLLQALVQQRRN